uniref:Tripartite motif-containing protein 16-like n=1 Tax=Erpetoichthys calabaricus TaxID=27687 RepID=A0A8C4SF78_ERPCA
MAEVVLGHICEDQIICSICLEIFTRPVSTPCGHSFCTACIEEFWNQREFYTCPLCEKVFEKKPELCVNRVLAEIIDNFKETSLISSQENYAGPGEIECDFCIQRRFRAVKSCLTCLASYCEAHVRPHYEGAAWKSHKLVNPSKNLQKELCPKHQKAMELFCQTDQEYICLLCMMDEHKTHDAVTLDTKRAEMQCQIETTQEKILQRIQERQKKIEELKQVMLRIKKFAGTEIWESEKIFTELISSIEKSCDRFTAFIRDQERTVLKKTEELVHQYEAEINEMKKKKLELADVLKTDNHLHFLKNCTTLCIPDEDKKLSNISVCMTSPSSALRKELSEFKNYAKEPFNLEFIQIIQTGSEDEPHNHRSTEPKTTEEIKKCKQELGAQYISDFKTADKMKKGTEDELESMQPPEPKSRDDFLKYLCHLKMDQKTAHRRLCISDDDKKATLKGNGLPCSDHPESFDCYCQVLCQEGLYGGRFYWEVEWSGEETTIGVAYKNIQRKGNGGKCALGFNNTSWSLFYSDSCYSAWHNNRVTPVTASRCSRIGVYLDWPEGTLSFYSVSKTMTHLHTFKTNYTEPLYPAFGVGSRLEICSLKDE